MADIFTKAKRSQVMSRIRSRGNKDTELQPRVPAHRRPVTDALPETAGQSLILLAAIHFEFSKSLPTCLTGRVIFKWIFRAVIGFILLLTPVVLVAYFYPEKFLCVDSGKNVSADVIVVLGGGLHERPERATELFQQHAAPRILITGAGDDEINRLILLQKGVPVRVIEVENNSTTTRENAEFTLKLLRAENVHRVILVTSWYHSRRALKTFEHYAPDLKFYSRPSYYAFAREDWPQRGNGKRMRLEFLKLPGYWFRYGVNPF